MKSRPLPLAVGLNAGRWRTRSVVCLLEDDGLRLLGAGETASAGWTRGRLTDAASLSESIKTAVREAARQAGVDVRSAVVGVGGSEVYGADSRGLYEFGRRRTIEEGDLTFAIERGAEVHMGSDRMVLQVLPQDFTLDGRAGHRNPRGLACSRLEANVHVVTAPLQEHDGLIAAVHQAGLAVEETVFEPMAAAYAAILPEDRNRGVALVDIGYSYTGIAIYDGEAMVLASTLPISADHMTRDLAWGLRVKHGLSVAWDDAEALKCECGCAITGLTSDNSLVEVPSRDGRAAQEVPCKDINEILQARAEELFTWVGQEIRRAGMEQAVMEGIFLTGGGSRLNGMCDMAEFILNCQTRYGLPVGIEDWPAEMNDAAWTTAAGLSMYSSRLKLRKEFRRHAPGLLGLVFR